MNILAPLLPDLEMIAAARPIILKDRGSAHDGRTKTGVAIDIWMAMIGVLQKRQAKVIASTTAEGTIVLNRITGLHNECTCCDGPHIYQSYVSMADCFDPWNRPLLTASQFVDDFVGGKGPDKKPRYEGKRVRITVEIID